VSSSEDDRKGERGGFREIPRALTLLIVMVPCHAEVPVTSKRLVLLGCATLMAAALWPADAAAQRRVYRRPAVRTAVVVSAGYYRPYFFSPFYRPFYDPFWYPYYAQYPRYYYSRSWASARIEVKPRDAQVFVDGYYVGLVDQFDGVFQRLDLPAGEHELVVYLPGYRSYRQKTLFRPGEGYHFKAILEPLPAGTADEPAPRPSPDNRDPYRGPGADRGPRDPYRPPQDPNPPYPGERRDPRDPGRPAPLPGDRRGPESRDFGTLNVRVQPADAVIVIDGERWDSPDSGSRLIVELSAGPHRLEVRKEGLKSYSATIEIRPGETQSVNVSLQ
jgi:hypothetical protein